MATEVGSLTAEEIVADSKRYTLYDWQAQSKASPLAIDRAEGVYMYGVDGRRWLDFSSQLMGVNIGHADKRVTEAIARQAEKLPYISPFHAFEGRAVLGRKLAELWPGDIEKTFFTLGGAEANENAVKMAKMVTGRQKVLARYRSYHGSTYGTMMLTGDPRRWPNEQPPMPGVVHVLDPYHGPQRGFDDADTALALLEETIELEGPATIAAFILEPVTGTNGILIPPDGYMQGVRELCTRHGIMLIADEVMCGWGRTGEWFAVDHWNVVPDLVTTAKGLTSSYAPLGAVGLAPHVADYFDDNVFWGGLTYNTHPLGVAAAIAAVQVIEDDDLVGNAKRLEPVMRAHHETLAAKHPSVGRYRNIGLFGILELVKNAETLEPLSPFNELNEPMQQVNRFMLDNGLATFIRWWNVMTNPPLCITEDQLADGFEIIDRALEIADAAMEGVVTHPERIGFIGLGIMGKPMARNLIAAGYPLTVHSRSPGPVDELVAAGASRADGAAAVAAASDVTITMLPDTADVEHVLVGAGGVLEGAPAGSLVIDMSSIDPEPTRAMAAAFIARDVAMLDAPVSGGERGAIDAALSIMAGGDEAAFARAVPILESLGKSVVHVGPSGAGQVCKACNQLVVAATIEAVAEALLLAERSGVDAAKVRQALLGGFAGSKILEVHGQRMLDRTFDPGFRIRLHRKDARIIEDAADETGTPIPSFRAVTDQLQKAIDAGEGERDHSALYAELAREAGDG